MTCATHQKMKEASSQHERAKNEVLRYCVALIVTCGLLLYSYIYDFRLLQPFIVKSPILENQSFSFKHLKASTHLQWHSCGTEFLCARLELPLDYQQPANGVVGIALIMIPEDRSGDSRVPKRMPLTVNPGGPGGSGVDFVRSFGHNLRTIAEGRAIIGFDPRGVGQSLPNIDCFTAPGQDQSFQNGSTTKHARKAWELAGHHVGLGNGETEQELSSLYSRTAAISILCQEASDRHGKPNIFHHAQTTNVVKDMLGIVDAIRTEADNGRKLVFWGFSYGSLLGTTFASMYPDRVDRVIVDGVLHAENYQGYEWFSSIEESDTVWESFALYCYNAKDQCNFYRVNDTLATIEDRISTILTRLSNSPITLLDTSCSLPLFVTHIFLKRSIFSALFNPVRSFPVLAEWLRAIEQVGIEGVSPVYELPAMGGVRNLCQAFWAEDIAWESGLAISCGDKRIKFNTTVDDLRSIYATGRAHHEFADVWLEMMLGCNQWPISGTAARLPFPTKGQITTSYPLLFLSNTHDPVGPLDDAIHMAKYFKDSRIVEQSSMGHCSTSSVSRCTISTVRAYLNNDILPELPDFDKRDWPLCTADEVPWRPIDLTTTDTREAVLLRAWVEMGRWNMMEARKE